MIYLVEDDESIRELVIYTLQTTGLTAKGFSCAKDFWNAMKQEYPSLVLLDIMLPDGSGLDVLKKLKQSYPQVACIMLSALGQESDKVKGLNLGADDYMTKPFSVSELLARVEALCRRVGRSASAEAGEQAPASLVSGSFVLDENRRVLLKAGQPIELTQVEFQIMELFFRNPGTALVREKILKGVWGENYFGDVKIVDVNIRRLRMKVEDEPSHPAHIMTVWGYGYKWGE